MADITSPEPTPDTVQTAMLEEIQQLTRTKIYLVALVNTLQAELRSLQDEFEADNP